MFSHNRIDQIFFCNLYTLILLAGYQTKLKTSKTTIHICMYSYIYMHIVYAFLSNKLRQ